MQQATITSLLQWLFPRSTCLQVAVVLLASSCEAIYNKDSAVKTLSDSSIKKLLKKDGVYLVEFFAP